MKNLHLRLPLFAAVLLALPLLNSCYFNSAGHIFAQASYKAAVNPGALAPGSTIYTDGGSDYYIELERYNADTPVTTQYNIADQSQESSDNTPRATGDTTMVRISEAYAQYLMGQRSYEPSVNVIQTECDADAVKARCSTEQSTRYGSDTLYTYDYTSPAAPLWYTLGAFDWLCIDLPVTLVENCFFSLAIISNASSKSKEDTWEPPPSTKSVPAGAVECDACCAKGKIYTRHNTNKSIRQWVDCPFCDTRGYHWKDEKPDMVTPRTVTCQRCKGSGKQLNFFLQKVDCQWCVNGTGKVLLDPRKLTTTYE